MPRVSSLCSGECDDLYVGIAIRCRQKGAPKGKKSTSILVTVNKISVENTGVLPISEANTVMFWISSKINNDPGNDETDNQENLQSCEEYFRLLLTYVSLEFRRGRQRQPLTSPYQRTAEKLRTAIITMKTLYQTAALMLLSQKLIIVAAATSSAGAVMAMVYQKFQPVAVPRAGCTKMVACLTKPPVTGIKAESSPVHRATPTVINPMKMYPRSAPTGPARAMACPDARKRPVPCHESAQICTESDVAVELHLQSFQQSQSC